MNTGSGKNMQEESHDDRKVSLWWTLDNVPMSKVQLPDPGTDDEAVSNTKLPWHLISPTAPVRVFWDCAVLALLLYYVFAVPFRLCFMDTQKAEADICRDDYHMLGEIQCLESRGCIWDKTDESCDQEPTNMGLLFFDTAVDFFFLIDIFLNFRTAYTEIDSKASQYVVTSSSMIAKKYLKGWFVFDLAGSIPLDLILYLIQSDSASAAKTKVAARLPRFLRFAKILRFLKLTRAARMSKVIERIQEQVNIKPGLFRVIQFFGVFVIVAHAMACFLFFLGTLDQEFICFYESALCPLDQVFDPNAPPEKPRRGITWITQTKIVSRERGEVAVSEAPIDTQYLLSMYWAVTTMTTVGYGDIKPATTYEVTACILTMLIGATTFSYVVGNMASLISKLDGLSGAFKERMDQATVFMHENNIPKDLKLRIRKYYDYSFNHPLIDVNNTILKDLSPALQMEVVRFIRRDILVQVSLFQSMHNKQRSHLLAALQPKLIPTQHGPNDFIFHSGELGKCVYIIAAGEVDLIDPVTRETFATFRKGNYFGENALLPDEERRPFSARARSWCDVLALRVKDLEVVLHDFPAVQAAIRLTARLRWARLMKAYQAHSVLVNAKDRQLHLTGKTLLRVVAHIGDNGEILPFQKIKTTSFVESHASSPPSAFSSMSAWGARKKREKQQVEDLDELSPEDQKMLFDELQRTVLDNEVGKQLAAGIRSAQRGGWDWSRDWVDGEDISAESERLVEHYNGPLQADKAVKKTVGNSKVSAQGHIQEEEDEEKDLELSADRITPGVELERALDRIIRRLDVIEAQTDMHEVLVQLRRLNQLATERLALDKMKEEKRMNASMRRNAERRGSNVSDTAKAQSEFSSAKTGMPGPSPELAYHDIPNMPAGQDPDFAPDSGLVKGSSAKSIKSGAERTLSSKSLGRPGDFKLRAMNTPSKRALLNKGEDKDKDAGGK